ncbi:hypothetical protein GCM10010430_50580 [Kitasatospora cystarginea]|uniref:Uncharacterized protein n=1 Tax=Kitasatospora cystarginea TaxID=58350 RepID=A0ABN3EIQ5_9ACTN
MVGVIRVWVWGCLDLAGLWGSGWRQLGADVLCHQVTFSGDSFVQIPVSSRAACPSRLGMGAVFCEERDTVRGMTEQVFDAARALSCGVPDRGRAWGFLRVFTAAWATPLAYG